MVVRLNGKQAFCYTGTMIHFDRLRQLIAREAARLMYEEQIKEYLTAKRKAARRFGPEKWK